MFSVTTQQSQERTALSGNEQTIDNWNDTFAVDVAAAMLCTREVLKQSMLDRKTGAIINFPSTVSLYGVPRKTHYVTAKAALRAFTKTVALEVGPKGIRCNCMCRAGSRPTCGQTGYGEQPPNKAWSTRSSVPMCWQVSRCEISPSRPT